MLAIYKLIPFLLQGNKSYQSLCLFFGLVEPNKLYPKQLLLSHLVCYKDTFGSNNGMILGLRIYSYT